jgi:uncharacterized protein YpuA (DUF1002 family)
MTNTIAVSDIKDLMFDVSQLISRVEGCVNDADRGLGNSVIGQQEGEPRLKTIDNLFAYLSDAKHDMNRIKDDLKDIKEHLDNLLDTVEYEAIAEEIR